MSKNLPVRYTQQPTSIVSKHSTSRAEQKSAIIAQSQLKAMYYEQVKAHFAGQALEDISTSRMEHFAHGAEAIWDIKDTPGRPADLQDIINQAAVSTTLRMDSYQQKSADIAAAQIIGIQGESTYERPVFQPQGFFRRRLRDE